MLKTYSQKNKAAILIMAAIFVSTLLGCYNSKVATKQVDRAILEHPKEAATELRKAFPCIETPIKFITDSTGYRQWKDSVDKLNEFYGELLAHIEPSTIVDTLIVPDSVKVKQLLNNIEGFKKLVSAKDEQIKRLNRAISNVATVHDTIKYFVKDSAADQIIISQKAEIAELKLQNATNKGKKNMWFWICMGLLAIDGMYLFSKFKKSMIV